MAPRVRGTRGFSLVELVVAVGLLLTVLAALFQLLQPAQWAFATEPERADMQQRLRVAISTLSSAMSSAGAGPSFGSQAGALSGVLAPILPFRQGRRNADAPGTARRDTVTVLLVSSGAAQTTLAQPLSAQSGVVSVNLDPGCPLGDPACGFGTGATVLVFNRTGRYDLFSVSAVQASTLTLVHNIRDSSYVYPAGATRIVEVTSRTFYLKADPVSDLFQLVRYDGANGADVPVVDHVVGLSFEYRGDPEPPRMVRPLSLPSGPWTTYGPPPPVSGAQTTLYPDEENCLFTANGSALAVPRLPLLGPGSLVTLDPAQLTDGPWCPDAGDPNRYDADLFRIRSVVVTVRVESAAASLRGPAGPLFSRGGTSRGGARFLPDQQLRFEITPRNLQTGA